MTAGAVAVPTIIPLRRPLPGLQKTSINSNVKIELRTGTKGARIYYTINGTKPDPFQKIGERCTMQYRGPFTLPAGKQTVKALAIGGEGEQQSAVVTKTFEVEYVPPPEVAPVDDEMEFQQDLDRERSKMQLERATADLLRSTRTAWSSENDRRAIQDGEYDYSDTNYSDYSRRRAEADSRLAESHHSGAYGRQAHLPNGHGMYDIAPSVGRCLPEEYTTDTIRALQNMSLESKRDFLNYTTTTAKQYATTNEWMPTAYPTQSVRATPAPNGYYPQQLCQNIDFAFNNLPEPVSQPPVKRVETTSVASQTVYPFFPSQLKPDQQAKEAEEKAALEKELKERRPLLTAISPGKGFWRKQIDHIYQHLKAHAQNDVEFRALIGQPKMGKMIASSVERNGVEFNLTLTFSLHGKKEPFVGHKGGRPSHRGYVDRHIRHGGFMGGSDDDIMSEDSFTTRSVVSSRGRRRPVRRPKPKKKPVLKLDPLDAKLLRQLGSEGRGSSDEVQQLIDEGADPSCENKSGLPALHLAATNRHIDCIPVLIQAGADVDAKGPSSIKGNTALHEAVSLGAAGLKSVEALLSFGADQNVKNDRGETAYEMAVKAGYDNLVKRFAAALGHSKLQRMIRPRSSVQ